MHICAFKYRGCYIYRTCNGKSTIYIDNDQNKIRKFRIVILFQTCAQLSFVVRCCDAIVNSEESIISKKKTPNCVLIWYFWSGLMFAQRFAPSEPTENLLWISYSFESFYFCSSSSGITWYTRYIVSEYIFLYTNNFDIFACNSPKHQMAAGLWVRVAVLKWVFR